MNSRFGRYTLIVSLLLAVGGRSATGQETPASVTRTPPVGPARQVILHLYAVEMSGDAAKRLGLWVETKSDRGETVTSVPPNPWLLKDTSTWDTALEAAVRLGRAQVISAPTIATVSAREAEMEVLGVDFSDEGDKKAGAAKVSIQWNVTPTVVDGEKVQVKFRFRRVRTDLTRTVATDAGQKPAEAKTEVLSGVEMPPSKPTVVGALMTFESTPSSDGKKSRGGKSTPAPAPQKTLTLVVIAAELADAKTAATAAPSAHR